MARRTKSRITKPTGPEGAKPRREKAAKRRLTASELAADLVFEGPGDLSTNPEHLKGFGQPNRPATGASARQAGRKSLAQLFADSPLKGLDLRIERDDN